MDITRICITLLGMCAKCICGSQVTKDEVEDHQIILDGWTVLKKTSKVWENTRKTLCDIAEDREHREAVALAFMAESS